jgi:hypothetical protein
MAYGSCPRVVHSGTSCVPYNAVSRVCPRHRMGGAGCLLARPHPVLGATVIFLWSRTWPGPGWQLVGARSGYQWCSWLWRRNDYSE